VSRRLPVGTVTFLFTDIEASTRLLHELGPEGYADALEKHRLILRAAFRAHGGVEVDTQGDAFFVAFPDAGAAVEAAADAQRELESQPISVRMGLHTGTPHLGKEGYVGKDVHLGARIAAAGHGGQVLVSAATRALVDRQLIDLGEHRLRDFDDAVPIFQLGSEPFPPLKTISNTNLPRPASSFVGREQEIADITALLRESARLLTLTGPGGSGKTRLAIEAAGELVPEFKAGVFWVGLASLRESPLVVETIARTLGAKDGIVEHIGEREVLLLVDNLEQVVGAAPDLAVLVESCPNLRLLVTSRELLRVRGEVEYSVSPLAEPEAVELFCARARAEPDEATAELCRRLDNLPLALELAAARTAVLSSGQILDRLAQRLDLFKGGRDADPRQETLRATIAWSHDLLDEEEKRLFARLAVFRGGCTLESAEEIAEADIDVLQSLIDKSLLRHSDERFWMLETIRDFALERLRATGEEHLVRDRHLEHYLRLAEEAYVERYSRGWRETIVALAPELDNLRAAADWAAESDAEREIELVGALAWFWINQTTATEAEERLAAALGRTRTRTSARARALLFRGQAARARGKGEQAVPLFEEALVAWRELGDAENVANALDGLGGAHFQSGHNDLAERYYEASLELRQKLGHPELVTRSLATICQLIISRGDVDQAEAIAHDIYRRAADTSDWAGELAALALLAGCALIRGDFASAEQRYARAAVFAWEHGDRRECATQMQGLAVAVSGRGDYKRALRIFGATLAERERHGLEWNIPSWVQLLEEHLGRARAALGSKAAAAAEAEGRALPFERALDEALHPRTVAETT